MNNPNKSEPSTLTSQILDMIDQSGMNLNALAKAAGVSQPILYRFFNADHQTITLRNADKLCAYFGIHLTTPRKSKANRGTEARQRHTTTQAATKAAGSSTRKKP
jgi:DNA-binding Xre family transcriptional regulator